MPPGVVLLEAEEDLPILETASIARKLRPVFLSVVLHLKLGQGTSAVGNVGNAGESVHIDREGRLYCPTQFLDSWLIIVNYPVCKEFSPLRVSTS